MGNPILLLGTGGGRRCSCCLAVVGGGYVTTLEFNLVRFGVSFRVVEMRLPLRGERERGFD